ncbi:MAG: carbamoyltransferase HypF, partial [Actinobacteria bacterium]|nr:carbamoyltransferase HypF [Actinomycetota bacterium]
RDSARARDYCEISPMEHSLMSSPNKPIVLLEEKEGSPISRHVAEGLKHQGLFLPYTPLHYLLLEQCGLPLVMTSGNISGEPIATDNEEALERLSGVAGCFLLHDRDILIRYDDSVTRVFQGVEYPVRRARGYAPYPLTLSSSSEIEVLALGAELKNTFCLLRADKAYVGQHVGNMDNALALDHFEKALETVTRLFSLKPQLVACDLHPEYVTTQIAADYGIPVTPVQHHHAHIAGCMADNCLEEEVIGVAWDGTGYGEDGTVWGGEFLYCNGPQYRRLAHLRQYKMPGSDSCIYSIYRMAAGVLSGVYSDADTALGKLRQVVEIEGPEADIIAFQLENGVNALLTSSSGRLFDAAASITGMRRTAQYDGQAACELEAVAEDVDSGYPFQLLDGQGIYIVDTGPLFEGLLTDSLAGVQRSLMAGKFHHTMACIIAETCDLLSGETGIRKIALSGGVFQNVLLTGKVVEMLKSRNLVPVLHRRVPCNDGGIAFGQAVVAAGRFAQSTSKVDSEDNSEGGFIEKDKSRGSVGDGALSI